MKYKFEEKPENRPQNAHPDSPSEPEPYFAEEELKQAVNLGIYLRRPLLLEGEAGCGKTRLARAVAYELGLPFYRWNVRSTSKAKEGLYEYDAILRLHDVQAAKFDVKLDRDPSDARQYRTFGALGKAFQLQDCPGVVLIDEIDKADLDFPNDLLTVLDEPWSFNIPETGEYDIRVKNPEHRPIIFVTSNKEKGNLPAPFLRRCLYYFLSFPDDPDRLERIVEAHYARSREEKPSKPLMKAAIARFLKIRLEGGLFKTPGTSEFLDWLRALHNFCPTPYSASELEKDEIIPYRELLFKLRDDWNKFVPV